MGERRRSVTARSALAAGVVVAGLVAVPSAAQATSPTCPCSIWSPSSAPSGGTFTDGPYELGVRFEADETGTVTALRFYRGQGDSDAHTGHLWAADGTLLASVDFASGPAGWQQAPLSNPVAVAAGTSYVASYSTAADYVADGYGLQGGVDNPPLHALADGPDAGDGVFDAAPGTFPTLSFHATNYWVDVVFEPDPAAALPEAPVAALLPAGALVVLFGLGWRRRRSV